MHSRPLSVSADGNPSAHVLNLRALHEKTDTSAPLPRNFHELRGFNFVPAAVHDRSARLTRRLQESGWDNMPFGSLIGPPALAVMSVCESLGASRFGMLLPVFPRRDAVRGAAIFFLLCLLIALPVKLMFVLPAHMALWRQQVMGKSSLALMRFEGAARALEQGDVQGARSSFLEAQDRIREVENSVGVLGQAAGTVGGYVPMVGNAVRSPLASLDVGTELASAGVFFTDGLTALTHLFSAPPDALALPKAHDAFFAAHAHAAAAARAFTRVDVNQLPADMAVKAGSFRDNLASLLPSLAALPDRVNLVATLLGHERLMRYLIVFENNAELRPAGGFAGSIALVDVDRGRLRHIEIPQGGSYDLQGSQHLLFAAPEPLERFHQRWEFQDTNWFSDWPTSARTMMTFYEKAGGPSVDGVIGLTTTALEELLASLGPVTVPSRHLTLTKENAFFVLQSAIEQEHAAGSVRPKAVLRPVMEALLDRVFALDQKTFVQLLPGLERLMRGRHLMVYAVDPALERSIIAAGLGGEIRENSGSDYLSVVSANIGGGKSDRVVEDVMSVETNVGTDGTLESTVRLQRTHHGISGTPFVGVPNISYLRFYVPHGSVLLSATGFTPEAGLAAAGHVQNTSDLHLAVSPTVQERPGVGTVDAGSRTRITEEFGKTVFGQWLSVDPASSATVELRYRLPFSLPLTTGTAQYTLLVQKQPGTQGQTFHFHIVLPPDWIVQAAEPQSLQEDDSVTASMDRDHVFGALLTHT